MLMCRNAIIQSIIHLQPFVPGAFHGIERTYKHTIADTDSFPSRLEQSTNLRVTHRIAISGHGTKKTSSFTVHIDVVDLRNKTRRTRPFNRRTIQGFCLYHPARRRLLTFRGVEDTGDDHNTRDQRDDRRVTHDPLSSTKHDFIGS